MQVTPLDMRWQMFIASCGCTWTLVRVRALMHASAQAASTSSAGQHKSSAAPTAEACDSAELLQKAADFSETSEVLPKRKRPLSGPGDMQEVQAKRSRLLGHLSINGQPHDREQHDSFEKATDHPFPEHQTGSQMWQCQHSSQVSIATAGCASVHIVVVPFTDLLSSSSLPGSKPE